MGSCPGTDIDPKIECKQGGIIRIVQSFMGDQVIFIVTAWSVCDEEGGGGCPRGGTSVYINMHIYDFLISTIIFHHLDGLFGPNLWTQSVNFFFSGVISTTSSVMFIAARISYVRFFTAVHIYDFHISTITIHHLY